MGALNVPPAALQYRPPPVPPQQPARPPAGPGQPPPRARTVPSREEIIVEEGDSGEGDWWQEPIETRGIDWLVKALASYEA
jgi:hypothetical protein